MSPEPLQSENEAGSARSSPIHLADYWIKIRSQWMLVVACTVIGLALSLLKSFLTVPLYQASTTLNIERDTGSPLDIQQGSYYPDYYNPEFLPTQLKLLTSRAVAEDVVRRLNLVQRSGGNVAGKPDAKKDGQGSADRDKDRVIAARARRIQQGLATTPIRGTTIVELSYISTSAEEAAEIANATAEAYLSWRERSKYESLGQASQFLISQIEKLKAELEDAERRLQAYGRQKDIVSLDPNTNVTLQKLETLNKDYAGAVADRVSKEAKYYEVQGTKPEALAEASSAGLVTALRADILKLEREYAEKLSIYKPDWPAMQQLRSQITKVKQHYDGVVEESVLRAREAAKAEYQTALRREESFKQILQTQKGETMNMNVSAVEYNNLRIEAMTKRTLLDSIMKRQSETELTSQLRGQRQSSIRIVERALIPVAPFVPSHRRSALMGSFLGLAFGVGLVFLLDYLDRSIRKSEQVESLLGIPALGVIPSLDTGGKGGYGYGRRYGYGYGYAYGYAKRALSRKLTGKDGSKEGETDKASGEGIELHPHRHPRSTISEAYRSVRTALLLSRAGGLKTIVMTSTLPGEGKSVTSTNLAIVLGQIGKTVLLIDADLHKARLHKVFNVSNRVGLVSILAENADPGRAIQATQIPNVSVLTAGPSSPNPSGLLASEGMGVFLKAASQKYDYVVIDSPPVGAVADAILLGSLCDGVVICIRGGVTPREMVSRICDKLELANVRILGGMINNLRMTEESYQAAPYYGYGEDVNEVVKGDSTDPAKMAAAG